MVHSCAASAACGRHVPILPFFRRASCGTLMVRQTNKSANVVLHFIQHIRLKMHETQAASCRNAGRRLAAFLNL